VKVVNRKCVCCSKAATRKLEIESEIGSVYLCDSTGCRETVITRLRSPNYQGEKNNNEIRFSDKVSATLIVALAIVAYLIISGGFR
jgi:hypothetical protein